MYTAFPENLVPATEAARLRALHQYQITDTAPEPIFDNYVAWVAQLFCTPIAVISVVDDEQVWFKATTGIEGVTQLPRAESMCSAAILVDAPVVTSDYSAESCRLISPEIAHKLGLNFYAGSALRLPLDDDWRVGMLAVIGREYRTLSGAEEDVLQRLAQLVSRTIELRFRYLQAQRPDDWQAAQREMITTLEDNATLIRYLMARNNGLNLDDPEINDLVLRRLAGINNVLDRRMNELVQSNSPN